MVSVRNDTLPGYCPVCAEGKPAFWFAKGGVDIFRCQNCFSAWVHPTPDDQFLQSYYRSATSFETKDSAHSVSVTKLSARRRRRAIQKYLRSGVVLDVGCGRGFFLAEMQANGYEVMGMELNPQDAEAARRRIQTTVVEQPFLEAQFEPGTFDVINLDQCLEHLADPERVLRRVQLLLKPTGILSVAVPNHSSVQSRVLGKHDPYITPVEHLSYFTLSGLQALLTRAGFSVLDKATYGDLEGVSILQGLGRLSPNALKSVLSSMAASPFERIVTFLAKPLTATFNVLDRGAIVEFYCGVRNGQPTESI